MTTQQETWLEAAQRRKAETDEKAAVAARTKVEAENAILTEAWEKLFLPYLPQEILPSNPTIIRYADGTLHGIVSALNLGAGVQIYIGFSPTSQLNSEHYRCWIRYDLQKGQNMFEYNLNSPDTYAKFKAMLERTLLKIFRQQTQAIAQRAQEEERVRQEQEREAGQHADRERFDSVCHRAEVSLHHLAHQLFETVCPGDDCHMNVWRAIWGEGEWLHQPHFDDKDGEVIRLTEEARQQGEDILRRREICKQLEAEATPLTVLPKDLEVFKVRYSLYPDFKLGDEDSDGIEVRYSIGADWWAQSWRYIQGDASVNSWVFVNNGIVEITRVPFPKGTTADSLPSPLCVRDSIERDGVKYSFTRISKVLLDPP